MKKLAAFITACVLILSTCAVGASAAEYGRNPDHKKVTAQGEYIYYFEDNAIYALNIVSGKRRIVFEAENSAEDAEDICVMGNCLYYVNHFYSSRYYGDPVVYKVDIGSGKRTEFYKCSADKWIHRIITPKDKIYIQFDDITHDDVPSEYYVDILDTEGNFLKYVTSCLYNNSEFIDTDSDEACIAAWEVKIIYGEEDGEGYDVDFTYARNIAKIKSDLSVEKITIPAKIGKSIEKFVYCGEKYIYYIDNKHRLCRYNTETEKYAVLVDGGVNNAHYRNGAVYFVTSGEELKKYKSGSISTVREYPDDEFYLYFFNDYILYYYDGIYDYDVIDYDGRALVERF